MAMRAADRICEALRGTFELSCTCLPVLACAH
jgi:hypothetical protein